MVVIDKIDNKILMVLKENSKLSYRKIAEKLLMPVTTVHHRIRKLERLDIIKKYSVVLNNKKLGKGVCAYILIKVDYDELKRENLTQHGLAVKLKHIEEFCDVAIIAGSKDIILKVRTHDVDELNQLVTIKLRNTSGIESTETLLVLEDLTD